jgi:epoxide hydrolase-like predicted phosphatase
MIRAIFFDCFGVLISDGLELVCRRLDQENPEAREFIRHIVWLNNTGQIHPGESTRRIAAHMKVPQDDWRALVKRGEVRDDQMLGLVRQLRGDYKTGLMSNIAKVSLHKRFSEAELRELFDEVIISGEIGHVKPQPEIYQIAADKLGLSPQECVFIDDRRAYAQAAEQVGMHWIYYENYRQLVEDLEKLLGRPLPVVLAA